MKKAKKKSWKTISKKNKRIIGVIAAAVVVLAIVLIAVLANRVDDSEKGSAEEIVKVYYEAFENADGEKLVQLLYPSVMQAEYFETVESSVEEKEKQVAEDLNVIWDEAGNVGAEYTWSIKKAEHLDKLSDLKKEAKEAGFENLDVFQEEMDSLYKMYGLNADKISKAYAVEVEFVVNSNGKEHKTTFVTYAYKYEKDWYIIDMNSRNLSSWITSLL